MKKLLILIMLATSGLAALNVGQWQNLRFSGQNATNSFYLLTEIAPNANTSNKVLFRSGSSVSESELNIYDTNTSTYQQQVPGTTARAYLGSRQLSSTGVMNLYPVYYEGSALPGLADITKIGNDEQNTSLTNIYDIVADYVSFSDTKLYMAIQNRGGGFPTSGSFGTVYNSYMSIIADPVADPDDPDTIVWALNYMNVALGGISPGLYKITGTGTSDLIRIGDIQSQIVSGSNLLIMSCNISDLMADPDFAAWFDPANPVMGTQTITNRTTVIPFAITQQDESAGATVHLQKLYYDPQNLANVSVADLIIGDEDVYFTSTYNHAPSYFPMDVFFSLDGTGTYPMYPQSFDYTQPVVYRTANLRDALPEFDLNPGNTQYSMGGDSYVTSGSGTYSYILGLNAPRSLQAVVSYTELILNWEPVTHSLMGTPVTITRYRIEFSNDPGFPEPLSTYFSSTNEISIPLAGLPAKSFYRVIAEKQVP
jgi:hypothetical protein